MTDTPEGYTAGYQQVQVTQPEHGPQQQKPASNDFIKTEYGQQNKAGVAEMSAEYANGQGKVASISRFRKAILYQDFEFGPDGELNKITVEKRLLHGIEKITPKGIGYALNKDIDKGNPAISPEMRVVLVRNREDGEFGIQEKSSNFPGLREWENEFQRHLIKQQPQPKSESLYSPPQQISRT